MVVAVAALSVDLTDTSFRAKYVFVHVVCQVLLNIAVMVINREVFLRAWRTLREIS